MFKKEGNKQFLSFNAGTNLQSEAESSGVIRYAIISWNVLNFFDSRWLDEDIIFCHASSGP
jgi:hypothetical protein